MLRKAQRQLHLVAAGYAPVERPRVIENDCHLPVGHLVDRQFHFAGDDVVGEIGEQFEAGVPLKDFEREEEIVGQPAAMRFDVDGYARLRQKLLDGSDQTRRFLKRPRQDLELQIEVVDGKPRRPLQRLFDFGEALRNGKTFQGQAFRCGKFRSTAGSGVVVPEHAETVEAGRLDARHVVFERALGRTIVQALHRPQRLEHEKFLHRPGTFTSSIHNGRRARD